MIIVQIVLLAGFVYLHHSFFQIQCSVKALQCYLKYLQTNHRGVSVIC